MPIDTGSREAIFRSVEIHLKHVDACGGVSVPALPASLQAVIVSFGIKVVRPTTKKTGCHSSF